MGPSIESSRPILAHGSADNRFSTYTQASTAPSTTPSIESTSINEINECMQRLEDPRPASQRFVPSESKCETLAKLALGAKLERALDRRLSKQDFVPRTPVKSG
ncbi:hypothetical protein EX30DRAFT_115196 [Ascodesmis nigricans]|uniref:Uncharacterized protein n=1 Tax=Ascodesmis nigricans TaxID=341454 RepID=A0A4S2MQA6_9PEZI|nr:hypothetical protein EX30DRAFT_115196 [Ascodesmis nigricans]